MAQVTYEQLYQYAGLAGFREPGLHTIVAIAQAESGGRSDAVNKSDPYGGSYGILQINGAHIIGMGGNAVTLQCAYDPACSFRYAYKLSGGGTNFRAWGSYTNGSYTKYLQSPYVNDGSVTPIDKVGTTTNGAAPGNLAPLALTGSPLDGIAAIGTQFTALMKQFKTAFEWLANPMRIIKMVVGIGLLWLSIALMMSEEAAPYVEKAAVAAL